MPRSLSCAVLLCDLRGISRELVEGRGPAAHVAVAALGTEEGPLVEGLDRLAALLFEGDGDKRLNAGRRTVIVPCERENEPFVLDDLAIDAAEPVLAMCRRRDHRAVGTAYAEVDLYLGAGEIRRTHPPLHMFRVGPERKEQRGRCVEGARDAEFVVGQCVTHLRFSLALSSAR